MVQILTGYFVTQVAGALATYSIADHLAKGSATADEIATWAGVDPQAAFRLLRACTSLGLATYDGKKFTVTPLLGTLAERCSRFIARSCDSIHFTRILATLG